MFDLVADIESYPAFLPWCHGARILEKNEKEVIAELIVGLKAVQEGFTSQVLLERPTRIVVSYAGGPLSHLRTVWTFAPDGTGCSVGFDLDFSLRSRLLGGMMDFVFKKAFGKMAEAFEQRAYSLYGPKK